MIVHPHILDDSIFTDTRKSCLKDLRWNRTIKNDKIAKANRCLHYLMRHQSHHQEC
jgi:hypothetical protein